jgi:hypothetical protein
VNFDAVCHRGQADYARWVVGQVVFQQFRVRGLSADDWSPLAVQFVRKFIPIRAWPRVRERLVRSEVLEWDRRYRLPAGGRRGKAYGFRVGSRWRDQPIAAYELRNPELLDNITHYRARQRAEVTDPVHVGLRAWADRLEVLPDAPAGDPVLDAVATGDHWFSVCEQGRVHTPATTLSRPFRRHVRLAGRELVAVDVCCSQPTLLAVVLSRGLPVCRFPDARPSLFQTRGGRGRGKAFVVQCSEWCQSEVQAGGDDFLADCLRGILYDRMARVWGRPREEVKRDVLRVLYGTPNNFDPQLAAGFAATYPTTWATVLSLSRYLHRDGWTLAGTMQAVESGLMIHGAAARFLREHPETPVLTVHDSLLVPHEAAEAARAIIQGEWVRRFGLEPTVKVSSWT